MQTTERRYDIDWVRVIAIGLLIFYHISIAFQPWGIFLQFIQSDKPIESLWIPMSLLNIWRIPLLFFVSGMGVSFAIRKRSWKQLILERSRRILIPFVFGIGCIVPLHYLLWQKYYNQDITYVFHPSHLWFLGNIFIYVMVLSPLFFYLKLKEKGRVQLFLSKLFRTPLGLLIIVAAMVLEVMLIRPETYETYSLTLHGFLLGLLAFLFGFMGVQSGPAFWNTVKKWRWILFILAVGLFLVRNYVFELNSPNYLKAIESCSWIFAVFGFAYRHLNRPGTTLSYLSQAAYPVYILHMLFLYLGSSLILPMEISPGLRFFLVVTFTALGCFTSFELLKKVGILRILFGLKPKP